MLLCWRSHLGTKSLPDSTQELRLSCDRSKNVFALRGPNEVIRTTTRGRAQAQGAFGRCNGRDCYSEHNCRFDGRSVQNCKSSSRRWKKMKKNAEPIHFVDRVRKIGGFYEQLLTSISK